MKYYIIALLLSFASLVEGQVKQGALQVGSKFPVMESIKLLNGDKLDLQTSQSKVIILEFFDTYCGTCIESMPKLKALQKAMNGRVEVYMTTWQDRKTIEEFYKKNKYLKETNGILPTIVSDTILQRMFPHKSVPHSVWIYKGDVQAITYADYVKEKYLYDLLNTDKITVPIKDDFKKMMDIKLDRVEDMDMLLGYVKITGYDSTLEQKAGLNLKQDSLGRVVSYFNNMDVFGSYTSLWTKIKNPTFLLLPERIVWKVSDSSRYYYNDTHTESYQEWIRKNGISYKRVQLANYSDSSWARVILNDLDAMLGLKVRWTTKETSCLVLRRKDKSISSEINNEIKSLKIESTNALVFLLDYSGKYPPTIDEVNEKLSLQIPSYNNLDELNLILKRYGLEILKEKRVIEVLEFIDTTKL